MNIKPGFVNCVFLPGEQVHQQRPDPCFTQNASHEVVPGTETATAASVSKDHQAPRLLRKREDSLKLNIIDGYLYSLLRLMCCHRALPFIPSRPLLSLQQANALQSVLSGTRIARDERRQTRPSCPRFTQPGACVPYCLPQTNDQTRRGVERGHRPFRLARPLHPAPRSRRGHE